jgi:hypothetical protein
MVGKNQPSETLKIMVRIRILLYYEKLQKSFEHGDDNTWYELLKGHSDAV